MIKYKEYAFCFVIVKGYDIHEVLSFMLNECACCSYLHQTGLPFDTVSIYHTPLSHQIRAARSTLITQLQSSNHNRHVYVIAVFAHVHPQGTRGKNWATHHLFLSTLKF